MLAGIVSDLQSLHVTRFWFLFTSVWIAAEVWIVLSTALQIVLWIPCDNNFTVNCLQLMLKISFQASSSKCSWQKLQKCFWMFEKKPEVCLSDSLKYRGTHSQSTVFVQRPEAKPIQLYFRTKKDSFSVQTWTNEHPFAQRPEREAVCQLHS